MSPRDIAVEHARWMANQISRFPAIGVSGRAASAGHRGRFSGENSDRRFHGLTPDVGPTPQRSESVKVDTAALSAGFFIATRVEQCACWDEVTRRLPDQRALRAHSRIS